MMQETAANAVPNGGQRRYVNPEDGWEATHPYYVSLLNAARAHRVANGQPIPANWTEVFEDNLCQNTSTLPCEPRDTGVRKALAMARRFTQSMTTWARSGFKLADDETLARRRAACAACPHWEDTGLVGWGFGRCGKCGCSTHLKSAIFSERCPLQKW